MGTRGDWREYSRVNIKKLIFDRANMPDLSEATAESNRLKQLCKEARENVISELTIVLNDISDVYIQSLLEKAKKVHAFDEQTFILHMFPKNFQTRDAIAANQGPQAAPHQEIIAQIGAIRSLVDALKEISRIARQAGSHIVRLERTKRKNTWSGTNVFIGHGRAHAWRDLKDFIKDRLHLPYDEFNRVPIARITNVTRLSQMLDAAAVAFIVLTAEDEQSDGSVRGRMNVIHEAGLFQGRLGFTRAIVLLEEGCEAFSNIDGLGQIRFPAGNIAAKFEEIRRVLEREGIIGK